MAKNYQRIARENGQRYGAAIDEYGPRLLADRYSNSAHFIYQLLQNADDAIGWRLAQGDGDFSRKVSFELQPDALTFRHCGLPFQEEHVRGICRIGKGSTGEDPASIGKQGIGFKSVYAYTQHPEVHSGDEHFVIDSFVRPRSVAARSTASGETLFFLPLDHPRVTKEVAYRAIEKRFRELGLKTLLFLRNIESVTWKLPDEETGVYSRHVTSIDEGPERVKLLGVSTFACETSEDWLVFRRSVKHREQPAGFVEIAFSVTARKGIVGDSIARVDDSPLFAFLPTEKQTHFGFLIQGPYRTTPSRDSILENDVWNQYLISQTAELLFQTMLQLSHLDLHSVATLEALVVDLSKYVLGSPAAMFRPLADTIVRSLQRFRLIPGCEDRFIEAEYAHLCCNDGLRSLLSDKWTHDLSFYVPGNWVTQKITRDRTPQLYRFLSDTIGIREFAVEEFVRTVPIEALAGQSDESMVEFYRSLLDEPALRGRSWFAQRPIVRLEDGSHVAPFNANGSPNAYLPGDYRTEFPTVKRSICQHDDARRFLLGLGLTEPDPVDDVIHNVLPRYDNISTEFPHQYDDDVDRIIQAFRTNSIRRREELVERLRQADWIPVRDAKSDRRRPSRPYADIYLPNLKLQRLFHGHSLVSFVEPAWLSARGEACRAVLAACGLTECHLQRKPCELSVPLEEFDEIRRQAGLDRYVSFRVEDYAIPDLERLLSKRITTSNPQWQSRSLLLWDCLHDALRYRGEAFFYGEYEWQYGHESRSARFPAAFIQLLRKSSWLPGSDGQPKSPSQLSFDQLPDEFRQNASPLIVALLEFKPDDVQQLAAKTGIDEEVLDILREQGISANELRKRLGLRKRKAAGTDAETATRDGRQARNQLLGNDHVAAPPTPASASAKRLGKRAPSTGSGTKGGRRRKSAGGSSNTTGRRKRK